MVNIDDLDKNDPNYVYKVWKQLEYDFKVELTQKHKDELKWDYYEKNIDNSNSKWVIYLLTAVHLISIAAFKLMKFNDDYISHKDWEEFIPKFMRLGFFLGVILVTTFITIRVHLAKAQSENLQIGPYFYLWFRADQLLIFFSIFTILVEYSTFYKIQNQTS